MKILFYPSSCLPFKADSLDNRPLGGIETAVIRLAEAISSLGQEVFVLSSENNPQASEPLYIPLSGLSLLGEVDLLIAVRNWTPLTMNIPAKIRMLWTGDSYDQFQNAGIGDARLVSLIDRLLCVSEWQKATLCTSSGFPREKTMILRNGFHAPYFHEGAIERHPKRLIYTSTPYRGLSHLPRLFRKIVALHPDAELRVCSGFDVYAGKENYPEVIIKEFEAVKADLESIPSCTFLGNIKQRELANELRSATILAYPNTFEETSCIAVLEAKAAGCIPVTSKRAALPETVGSGGICVEGEPGTESFDKSFIESIDKILSDVKIKERHQTACKNESKTTSWDNISKNFLDEIANTGGAQ